MLLLPSYNLYEEIHDFGFLILATLTIFFGSYLRIQMPHTKVHLSVSEVLIFYTLLTYGGGSAVLLAAFEALYTSLNFRRKGITIKNKTILFNITLSIISTYLTATAITYIYSAPTEFRS